MNRLRTARILFKRESAMWHGVTFVIRDHPSVCNAGSHPHDPFSGPFKDDFIKMFVHSLSWRNKFLVDDSLSDKKTTNQHWLTFDSLNQAFFGRGKLAVCHSSLCLRIVLKISDSSRKKFCSLVMRSRRSWNWSKPACALSIKLSRCFWCIAGWF